MVRLVCGLDVILTGVYRHEVAIFTTYTWLTFAAVIIALSSSYRVKHTNIVYLKEVYDSKSKLYLVMEL